VRRLGNLQFQLLRSWLYPGQAGEGSAPTQVSDELQAVVDIEQWVPVNRYVAQVTPPAVVARRSVINFETFVDRGGVATFTPLRFAITDFKMRFTGAFNVYFLNTRFGGDFDFASNLTTANTVVRTMSGDASQLTIQTGDLAGSVAGSPSYIGNEIEQALPNIAPGNCIQLVQSVANASVPIRFSWTERRPAGTPI